MALSKLSEDQHRSVFFQLCNASMDPLAALLDKPSLQPSATELRSRITLLEDLPDDIRQYVFSQLCNVLEPRLAVYFSSASRELWELTQALRQQLRTDHEVAAALCRKVGLRSCKELREAKEINLRAKDDSDLVTLGALGSVLPALEKLELAEVIDWSSFQWLARNVHGVQRLAEGLGAGALPNLMHVHINSVHVGDAGASALAAALDRGALPRLKSLGLSENDIGDAGLVALAPVLRRRFALECLNLMGNPCGDEGLAALLAPLQTAGALLPQAGGLAKLRGLGLHGTQVSDAGCAALVAALDSGALPALKTVFVYDDWESSGGERSAAATATVREALDKLESRRADLVRSLRTEVEA